MSSSAKNANACVLVVIVAAVAAAAAGFQVIRLALTIWRPIVVPTASL